jgi:hypothetical protein
MLDADAWINCSNVLHDLKNIKSAGVEFAMKNQLSRTSPIAIMSTATHVCGLQGHKILHSNVDTVGYKFVRFGQGVISTEEYRKNASPKPYSTLCFLESFLRPCLAWFNQMRKTIRRNVNILQTSLNFIDGFI